MLGKVKAGVSAATDKIKNVSFNDLANSAKEKLEEALRGQSSITLESVTSEGMVAKFENNPMMGYNWQIQFPRLEPIDIGTRQPTNFLGMYEGSEAWSELMGIDPKIVGERVTSVELPSFNVETKKIKAGLKTINIPIWGELGNLTMNIDEYDDGATYGYITAWMGLTGLGPAASFFGKNDGISSAGKASYKRDIFLTRFSSSMNAVEVMWFKGVFPSAISPASQNYEDEGILTHNISFSCDDAIYCPVPMSVRTAAIEAVQENIAQSRNGSKQHIPSIGQIGKAAAIAASGIFKK